MNEKNDMQWSPSEYEKAAVIAAEAGREAISRLDWMTIQPEVIVAECGTSEIKEALQQRYPTARIHTIDEVSTLGDGTVDMVFANLATLDLQAWRRVLRTEGLLMFTALGLDTLRQLRGICNPEQLPPLFDLHDCGDMLVKAGFADPVLDVDYYTLSYQEQDKLWYELQASKLLRGDVATEVKNQLRPIADGSYELTFEVVHAHAFAPASSTGFKAGEDGVTRIPLSHLRRQKG